MLYTQLVYLRCINTSADVFYDKGKKLKSADDENAEWKEKYGEEGAKVIRETVDKNMKDYEYLKQFAIKV